MTETESKNLLERVFIASPCGASWDAMDGTDRVRNCGDCSRQVFNLSDMSGSEAEKFLKANGTSHCLTFYRRKDGTIMTDDCPVGLRKIRNAVRRFRRIAAVFLGTIFSTMAAFAQSNQAGQWSHTVRVVETSIPLNKYLWQKPKSNGVLHQLGVPDVGPSKPMEYIVPSFSELRSGKYALGKNLVERQGRTFVIVDVKANLSKKNTSEELLEPVPTRITIPNCDVTAKLLEVKGYVNAADAFNRVYMKTFGTDGRANQQIASNYRDFLFRQGRIEEGRKVEKDCYLEPEEIFEGCEALKPLSKRIRIDLFNPGWVSK